MDFKTPEKYFSFTPTRLPPDPKPPADLEELLTAQQPVRAKTLPRNRPTLVLPRGIQRGNT